VELVFRKRGAVSITWFYSDGAAASAGEFLGNSTVALRTDTEEVHFDVCGRGSTSNVGDSRPCFAVAGHGSQFTLETGKGWHAPGSVLGPASTVSTQQVTQQ
jgi:hypothetical protein